MPRAAPPSRIVATERASKPARLAFSGVFAALALTVAYVVAYCDRTILTLLVAPLKRDLAISDSQVALLMGFSFAIFYSVAGIPLGRLTDRHNRRNLIVTAIVAWSVATAACAFCYRFSELLAARVCVGVGEASLVPAALSIISDYFGPKYRARAVALFICGAPLGSAAAYLTGGLFLQHERALSGFRSLIPLIHFNWQVVFIFLGCIGLVVALPIMLMVEPPRTGVTGDGKLGVEARQRKLAGFLRSNHALLYGVIIGPAVVSIAYYALLVWAPAMVSRRFDWEPIKVALWFTPLSLIGGLAGPWVGAWTGKRLSRAQEADGFLRAMILLAALGAICCAIGVSVPIGFLAVAGIFVAMGLLIAALSLPQMAIQYVVPGDIRGRVMASWVFGANMVGFGLGPSIVAGLTDHLFYSDSRLNLSLGLVCVAAIVAGGSLTGMQLANYRSYADVARGGSGCSATLGGKSAN